MGKNENDVEKELSTDLSTQVSFIDVVCFADKLVVKSLKKKITAQSRLYKCKNYYSKKQIMYKCEEAYI